MKTFHFLTAFLLSLVLLKSCVYNEGITPSKNYITRDYKVTEFSALDISTVGDVYYTQSTNGETSLEIYGPDNIIDLIQVSIKDNTLHLSMNKKGIKNIKKMKITISTPHLSDIQFNGVGDVHIKDGLQTNKLNLHHHGVGDMNIHSLSCEEVKATADGVGNTYLHGTAERATLRVHGVGDIDAFELKTKSTDASSKGVGSISCFASESISAEVQGVGSIKYKGNPAEKRINKNGIGSIKGV
ncbi:DUF2807 domain-containing protein [Bacteroides sp. OttesenSCG-928-D19]|nr:DUF2807 domain-containing protein [Bacteroides sp. OttesenSCG-928-N06]MDL2305853.1 DUF2807 domain-containing protein [Bacteroides sp. OttesenSCG-928-D19]